MEDHLCPRLVQPQAACLSCLARPQPLAKPQAPCYYNRINTISTKRVSKRSRQLQTLTYTAPRPNYAVQPATLPSPSPQNTIQHFLHNYDLDEFSSNITSITLPTSVSHPCETCPLYTRLMKRYTGFTPLLTPINSWRDLSRRK
jgi:hypothetical protein